MRHATSLVLALSILGSACGSDSPVTRQPVPDAGADSATALPLDDAAIDDADGGDHYRRWLWIETSEHILVTYSGSSTGEYFRYERSAAELSLSQRLYLEGFSLDRPNEECGNVADLASIQAVVTDRDGSQITYTGCSTDSFWTYVLLRPCVSSSASSDVLQPDTAPTIQPNDGCHHGLQGAVWLALEISEPGTTYTITVRECNDLPVDLTLHDQTGAVQLAAGEVSEDVGCPSLVHSFEQPGKYLVHTEALEPGLFYLTVSTP